MQFIDTHNQAIQNPFRKKEWVSFTLKSQSGDEIFAVGMIRVASQQHSFVEIYGARNIETPELSLLYSHGTGECLELDNAKLSHWDNASEVIESELLQNVVISQESLPIYPDYHNISFQHDIDSDDDNFEDPDDSDPKESDNSDSLSELQFVRSVSSVFSDSSLAMKSSISEVRSDNVSDSGVNDTSVTAGTGINNKASGTFDTTEGNISGIVSKALGTNGISAGISVGISAGACTVESVNDASSKAFELPFYSTTAANERSRYILVEESQLVKLLKFPPQKPCDCKNSTYTMTYLAPMGHCERYKWVCTQCKKFSLWTSSSYSELLRGFRSNAAVPAAFLSIGGSESDYRAFFDALNAGSVCSSIWNHFQFSSFAPMADAMASDQIQTVRKANEEPIIGIDARYDHGRAAEHCTVTGMDYQTRFIISSQSAHRFEAYNTKKQWNNWAGSLEPILAKEVLTELHNNTVQVQGVISDGCCQYPKIINELKIDKILPENCKYYLDGWHKGKAIVNSLPKLQDISAQELRKKVKNHFIFCLAHCEGKPDILLALWMNAINHWSNIHCECHSLSPCKKPNWQQKFSFSDADLPKIKQWFVKSIPFAEAQYLCKNTFTSDLEAFHRTILVYAPKCKNFWKAYKFRIALSILDWNENAHREILSMRPRYTSKGKRPHGQFSHSKEAKTYHFREWLVFLTSFPEKRPKEFQLLPAYQSCIDLAVKKRDASPSPVVDAPDEKDETAKPCTCGRSKQGTKPCCKNCVCVKNRTRCTAQCGCKLEAKCLNKPLESH